MTAAWLFLIGCESAPLDTGAFAFPFSLDPCDRDTPALDVGVGARAWSPLEEGDLLLIREYEHGGWYFDAAAITYNLSGDAELWQTLEDPVTGAVVAAVTHPVSSDAEQCRHERLGLRAFVDIVALSDGGSPSVVGRPLLLRMELRQDRQLLVAESVALVATVGGPLLLRE